MISHKNKFIFVEVPKTGTKSIVSYLLQFEDPQNNLRKICQIKNGGISHRPLAKYSMSHRNQYFCFAFVRNPWDRVVSRYAYHIRKKRNKSTSFKMFVENYLDNHKPFFHAVLQYDLVGHPGMDFIGRYETLQNDFNIVCDKIGIPHDKLPIIGKSKHEAYDKYYDDETYDIVTEKYAKDIEYFGYKFGE